MIELNKCPNNCEDKSPTCNCCDHYSFHETQWQISVTTCDLTSLSICSDDSICSNFKCDLCC